VTSPLASILLSLTLAGSPFAVPAAHTAVPAARAAAPVPCPIVPVVPNPPAPAPSPMPQHDADAPVVGGPMMATTGLAIPDGAPALPTNLSAQSWLVADLDTGAVLGACAPHAYAAPASVQKLLLAETVLPKLDPTQLITVTPTDLNFEPGSSAVGLVLGGQYTVETLWLGLFLNSGNDCAQTLARLGGGDRGVAGTIADMNAEAKRLGALETHAETPSGLDGPGQVTSAYDLALIFRADFARTDFKRYDSTLRADIPPQPPQYPKGYQIQNDNALLFQYPGALGGKVGYTDNARHTYVGAAERNGRRLVVTILRAERQPVRGWEQGAALLDWGFSLPADASVGRLVNPGELRPTPKPTPAPLVAEHQAAGAATSTLPTVTMAAVTGVVVLFAGVWSGLILRARRRARSRRPPG
jgi:serine-type D-Ala-D-Ala carboxypeptidase (penicillin-binding protein 5/6)